MEHVCEQKRYIQCAFAPFLATLFTDSMWMPQAHRIRGHMMSEVQQDSKQVQGKSITPATE